MSFLAKALKSATEAAKDASLILKAAYNLGDFSEESKKDGSPVTSADIDAQSAIERKLLASFPNFPIFGEEKHSIANQVQESGYYWFVDPLDGTKEFLKKSSEFTINIALVHRLRPVIGVICIPLWDAYYYASAGQGSYKRVEGQTTPIKVSGHRLSQAVLVESRDHTPPHQKAITDTLKFASKFEAGSSIKGCFVAEGKADLYMRLSPFWYWDVCAQDCIVTEAGGACTDLAGNQVVYHPQAAVVPGIIISNGVVHTEVVPILPDFI